MAKSKSENTKIKKLQTNDKSRKRNSISNESDHELIIQDSSHKQFSVKVEQQEYYDKKTTEDLLSPLPTLKH